MLHYYIWLCFIPSDDDSARSAILRRHHLWWRGLEAVPVGGGLRGAAAECFFKGGKGQYMRSTLVLEG